MEKIEDWLGVSYEEYVRAMEESTRSHNAIWSDPDIVTKYPDKWIAAFDGKVQLVADDMETLLRELDERKIPRNHAAIEYIEVEPRTLILNVKR